MTTRPLETPETDLDTQEAGLQAFFALAERWELSTDDQIILLGQPGRTTFFKWKKTAGKLPKDTLERLSHIFSIHKCLRILFKEQNASYDWLQRPNAHSSFGDTKPIDIMLEGRMLDLLTVRQYLDAQRGG